MVKSKKIVRKILFLILILAILIFSLFPFVQMLSTSLKYPADWGDPSLIPHRFNFEAYKEMLNIGQGEKNVPDSIRKLLDNPELTREQRSSILDKYKSTGDVFPFLRYFRNSFLLSFIAAFLSVVIAIFGAYSFSRIEYRGRGSIQRGVLFVYMFGGVLLLIPLFKMAVSLNMVNTAPKAYTALIIIYIVQTLPVSLYMLGNYFRTIPFSIEEAAYMEGMGRLGIIWKIIIPLSASAILSVFFYCFMIAWNEYLFASVFIKEFKAMYTLPIGLRTLYYSKNAIWDRIMAASFMTALPVITLFMFVQKGLTGGLSEGGVKG